MDLHVVLSYNRRFDGSFQITGNIQDADVRLEVAIT